MGIFQHILNKKKPTKLVGTYRRRFCQLCYLFCVLSQIMATNTRKHLSLCHCDKLTVKLTQKLHNATASSPFIAKTLLTYSFKEQIHFTRDFIEFVKRRNLIPHPVRQNHRINSICTCKSGLNYHAVEV